MRHHREHVAVARIDRDERAVLPGHRSLRRLLQIQVDRHDEAFARRVGDFLEHAQPPPDGVNFDLLSAGVAAQKTFPHALEAEFSDLVAHVVVRMRFEIAHVHFADVAEQMRGELAVQVMPRGRDLQTDAGQVELMRFERDDLLPSETLGDGDWLVRRAAGLVGVGNFIGDVIGAGVAREPFDRQRKIVGILGHDLRVERRTRIDQRTVIAIEDQSARRGHALEPNPVAIGQLDIFLVMQHLQVVQAHREDRQNREHHDGQRHDARFQQRHRPIIASRDVELRHLWFPTDPTMYSRRIPAGNPAEGSEEKTNDVLM